MTMPPFVTSKPIYETIIYSPALNDTTDLEAATKTITATEEATGTGNADYTAALTLKIPSDTRMAIKRIATRLSVTIDSDDGTHDLKCRVYVDEQDANHMLFDLSYTSTGNQLSVQDCLTGTKETIFNLLKDGNAHTFYFFFWSPGEHAPVISVCQLWEAVGSSSVTWGIVEALRITHTGFLQVSGYFQRTGSGNGTIAIVPEVSGSTIDARVLDTTSTAAKISSTPVQLLSKTDIGLLFGGSVATDINWIDTIFVVLRSN